MIFGSASTVPANVGVEEQIGDYIPFFIHFHLKCGNDNESDLVSLPPSLLFKGWLAYIVSLGRFYCFFLANGRWQHRERPRLRNCFIAVGGAAMFLLSHAKKMA
ncbi:hypothetical protein CEXT_408311 [Caerostris extrusa]|uniref:Uncharacterized protein n=1 Tax=Caerostris extrusa TaxID=172846 RepID=A0AAV4SGB1_CAEEX|nr:hypothetical protein CEXT_408311 [Caerostris extrusa]